MWVFGEREWVISRMRPTKTSLVLMGLAVVTTIGLFVWLGWYTRWLNEFVPYVPVVEVWQPDITLVEEPSLLTLEHAEGIVTVLREFDEEFAVRDSEVHIRRRLARDTEIIWNYTSRAAGWINATPLPLEPGGGLCPTCGYWLRDLTDSRPCPECGNDRSP